MVNVSGLESMIRFPFELLGTILNFFLKYLIPILIIGGALWLTYFLFKTGVVKRLSDTLVKWSDERKKKNELH